MRGQHLRETLLTSLRLQDREVINSALEELQAVDAYAALSPLELEDIAAGVRWPFETFTDCLARDRVLDASAVQHG